MSDYDFGFNRCYVVPRIRRLYGNTSFYNAMPITVPLSRSLSISQLLTPGFRGFQIWSGLYGGGEGRMQVGDIQVGKHTFINSIIFPCNF